MISRGTAPMLRAAMEQAGLDLSTLWVRYFGLGGTASLPEVAAHVNGAEVLDDLQHDMLVQGLNETFSDQDMDHPVPYKRD